MMKFLTKYDETRCVVSTPGQRLTPEYQLRVDDEGVDYLEHVGNTDLQASINSHKDSVDINLIMARIENGEKDLLERAKGFYADVTDCNVNLQDALNIGIKGESLYQKLPLEIKNKFSGYVDMANKPKELFTALQEYLKPPVKREISKKEEVKSEVNTDE